METLQTGRATAHPAFRLVSFGRPAESASSPGKDSGVLDCETVAAVARAIAQRTTPAKAAEDFAVICVLLRQKCGWSEERLRHLRHALAAELRDARDSATTDIRIAK